MNYIQIANYLIEWVIPSVLVLIGAVLVIAVLVYLFRLLIRMNFPEHVAQYQQKNSLNKQNRLARRGAWQFPVERFYRKCAEFSITEFSSDYSLQKATNIVIELGSRDGIKPENLSKYLASSKFQHYYDQGKEAAGNKDVAKAIRRKQPREAVPGYSESTFLQRVCALTNHFGGDKRRQMLAWFLQDCRDKIDIKNEYEAPLSVFEAAMILQPAKQSAANTQASTTSAFPNTFSMMSGLPDLSCEVEQLERWLAAAEAQSNSLNGKVILATPEADSILCNLRVCKTDARKSDSGVLHITLGVKLQKSFRLDVPESIHMCVDGILRGTVYFEDSPVGEVLFPLPLYGIACNSEDMTLLSGLCPFSVASDRHTEAWYRFAENDDPSAVAALVSLLDDMLAEDEEAPADKTLPDYTVRLTGTQNLWIMEV